MTRRIGTSAYGLRTPIIKQGDDLTEIIVDSLIEGLDEMASDLRDSDVLAITESLLARAQGNFCTVDDISADLNSKFDDSIGVVFPITSRNRFALILKAIARTEKDVTILLKYPSDEVGNSIMDLESLVDSEVNVYNDRLTEAEYRKLVGGSYHHPFTGIDYVDLYKSLAVNDNIKIVLSNNPMDILDYTDEVLIASIHDRASIKYSIEQKASKVYTLADIMNKPVGDSGYNEVYGLYGSNLAGKDTLKLFPRECEDFVYKVQEQIHQRAGASPQVMIYGDGAFKDPVTGIWEFADPVVSPAHTSRLHGTPNEIKLKYLADSELASESREDAAKIMKDKIKQKAENTLAEDARLGTTPRRITDLLGSLADLISGSGDKGTPVVLIKGYFDNFADE